MLSIICITLFLFTALYAVLMLVYRKGWKQQALYVKSSSFIPGTFISIVIPARNEAANIGTCIRSILAQDYPAHLFEIIVIDDHSTDNTKGIVDSFSGNVMCVSLSDHLDADANIVAYKKKALSVAIGMAKGELIVTTDADCIAMPGWLGNIASLYQTNRSVMIVAPVDFSDNGRVVEVFQSIDFMSMQGITAASHRLGLGNMCNGANLVFSKEAYLSVNGYEGIDNLASGDDYLLMMKIQAAFPDRISYLKTRDAIIATPPQPDWRSFLQQRIRWASKSGKYNDTKLTLILLLVYIYNFLLLGAFIAAMIYPASFLLPLIVSILIKIVAELYYLYPVSAFFKKQKQLKLFILLQPLHIVYIVLAGFMGIAGVYTWKDRKVK